MSARFRARRRVVDEVVHRAARWAGGQPDVRSVVVVGSYAYGTPRMGSDVDLVILSDRAEQHLADLSFIDSITPGGRIIRCEEWGPMHERRVRLGNGLLVEFGVTTPTWAALPLDAGTARVLSDGCKVVTDDGTTAAALASLGHRVEDWSAAT
jgi:hypothetical protein